MRKHIVPFLAVPLFLGIAAHAVSQEDTIAGSSVHNAPIKYSTLLPLAWSTEGWSVIQEGSVAQETGNILIEEINEDYVTIALMPNSGNAICDHVEVTYEDASTQTIDLAREGVLSDRQLYEIEFGVDPRHVAGLTLQCRAVSTDVANIIVYGEPSA